MLKKTINYTDFDGNKQSEVHYFNLNTSEIMEMELTSGGLVEKFESVIEKADGAEIIQTYKDLIAQAYGVRGEDGKSFRKSKERSDDFASSLAYDALFMELLGDPGAAAKFLNGVLPAQFAQSQEKLDEISTQTLEDLQKTIAEKKAEPVENENVVLERLDKSEKSTDEMSREELLALLDEKKVQH